MVTEDQTAIVALLQAPSTHGGRPVERIDTHSAIVFLAGGLAYKLKRAVRFDYLDFSTRERRKAMCDAELHLNRRTAPSLYRRVVAVTRSTDGTLTIGGDGEPVDWLLEMNRFESTMLLDRLAATHQLDRNLVRALGPAVARFHDRAEMRQDHGGPSAMSWVIEGNGVGLNEFGGGVFHANAVERLTVASRKALKEAAPLLEKRRLEGFVRQCHGDLHLGNIVIIDGQPTPFDGIEFNDEVSCIDVVYDLAFLLTDLWHRRLAREANAVFNGYVEATGDLTGLALLPLFMSCRAAIRAKTSATTASVQQDQEQRAHSEMEARQYLDLAEQCLRPVAPVLVAVGGYSGSGKSTVAAAIAPEIGRAPGALVIRSDEIRKRLCGVDPLAHLNESGYAERVTDQVYARLERMVGDVVATGQAAIADAVFSRPSHREDIEIVARDAGVPFLGLWLDAPESTLVHRVEQRQGDASDATAEIVRHQRQIGTGRIDWFPLDTLLPLHRSVETVRVLVSSSALAEAPIGEPLAAFLAASERQADERS